MVIPLNYLEQNQQAKIVWMALADEQKSLLEPWGFRAGVLVACVHKGNRRRMSAYLIRNKVIALRVVDANGILVKIL